MKNKERDHYVPLLKKVKRIMKITTLFILCAIFSISASTYAQNYKVTINKQNSTIIEVLKEIEKNSEFTFFFNDNRVNVNQPVSVMAKNATIQDVLDKVFRNTGYVYQIIDRQVLIKASASGKSGEHGAVVQQSNKRTITGTVKDPNGDPIIGANIVQKGTTNGTITDADGNFTITLPTGSATLGVSYIGYKGTEIVVGNKNSIAVTLKEDTEMLDEVVVVGYGTMKKKDLTGAVAAVKGDDLAARRTTQLSSALQGATSGVMVTRDNSAPGATASIKVRGVTTIGDSSPLVIVDGVPGDINQINPEDVESMSVLKDAASASIYGSRAAAGVIVVTTKRAKENDLALNYNFEYGWEMPTELPKYVGVKRYLEMTNETRYNDNNAGGWNQTYSEDQINNWLTYNATDPDKYPNVDWQDVLLKSSAPRQTHTINISGGSKAVKTKASFRYDNTDGLYVNKKYERYMIRINNDFKINKFLEAHLDVNFKRSKGTDPNVNPMGAESRMVPPIYAVRWTDGLWSDVKDGANVMAQLVDGGTKTSWYNRIGGKAGLDILPFSGLKISAVIAPNYNFDKLKTFRKQIPYTYANDPNTIKGYMGDFYTTKLTEDRNDSYDVTSQLFANYDKTFGKHNITAMLGYEDYYAFWEKLSASRDQYLLTNYPYLDLGPQDYRDNSGNAYEYAYRSLFGRLTYSFENRYLLQANFRRDGSSRFAKDNRWANFPSFSAGWVISEESFMKKIDPKVISYLKLRGSWGTLGNERLTDTNGNAIYYPYQAALNFGSALFHNGADIVSNTTAAQQYYAVHNISWETTETWDLGVDANFLNGRLRFTGDYYKKKTKDMLLSLEIPKFVGYDNPSVNAGKMNTHGYDFEIGWSDHVGDFNYSVSANLSDFVSKMGDLGGTEFLGDQVKKKGSEYNEWYGYLSDGLFQTQEDVNNSPKMNNNTKVGDVKYKDISGPDGVPDGKISSEYDRVLLGGSLPRYMFGVNFNVSYKGFDFAMMLQGVGSQNAHISPVMIEGLWANWAGFPGVVDGKYWSSKNTDEQNLAAKYPRLTRSNVGANEAMSDYWLFNGRYLRMKNLTLGYTLPSALTKKASIKSLRFYVAGNDLFCLSGYPHGWDPEVSTTGYPITTSLLFGVSVNF